MDFHGHEIDIRRAYHAIAMEYARRDLDEYQKEHSEECLSPQTQIDVMRDAYFIAYGHLCGNSEEYLQDLLQHDYPVR